MNTAEMRQALTNARQTMNAADNVAAELAGMLPGRLRKISDTSTLIALKRELKDFNIQTGRWRDKP
jgi:hypothetical protein